MEDKLKVLEVSPIPGLVKEVPGWSEAEVTNLDWKKKPPKEMLLSFDGLIADNTLQLYSWLGTLEILSAWTDCLKEGGELHVIVPSLEWACRQILAEVPSPASLLLLYGAQGESLTAHMSGITMRMLRADMETCGLSVILAKTVEAKAKIGNEEYPFQQHYVCGVKGTPKLRKE